MQETWQAFLEQEGATILNNDVIDFNDSDINLLETPIATPLAGFAMLAVSGNDRHMFLHGQFINDLNLIEDPATQISAWCNAKGQLISNFLIINTGIAYLLIFKEDLKEFILKRLRMFVMRSDVVINDISDSSPLLGLSNCNNVASLNKNFPKNPGEINAVDGLIVVSHPDSSGRYLITGSIEALIKYSSTLRESLTISGSHIWNLLDILAGLPWITSLTQEQYLPQMLNLDALKGMSYQKGCYPGQEVIARLHYRGEVKKRIHLIKSSQTLATGDYLYPKGSDDKVGVIINSEPHAEGLSYSLAILSLEKAKEKLYTDTQSNHEASVMELPYAIEP